MKKQVLCILLLLSYMPSNEAQSKKMASRTQILEVGEFHGDEVNARTSKGWLGLFVSKQNSALLLTSIRVSKVFDPVIDLDTNKITGKKVSVPQSIAPILLVRDAPSLKPGNVKTSLAKEITLTNGSLVKLDLGNQIYQITVESDAPERRMVFGNAKLRLSLGGITQTIFSHKMADEGGWTIIWAGDLDGDNRLDLYANLATHDNVSARTLFLSSQASKGQLVQKIAQFITTGC